MKVKLKQHYQDARIHLEPGQIYDGDLAPYLLQHRMAEQVEEAKPAPVPEPTPEPAEETQSQEAPKARRRKQ